MCEKQNEICAELDPKLQLKNILKIILNLKNFSSVFSYFYSIIKTYAIRTFVHCAKTVCIVQLSLARKIVSEKMYGKYFFYD